MRTGQPLLTVPAGPQNAVAEAGARLVDAFGRRAWDEVADCFSADAINDDRRVGLRDLLDGRESIVTSLRTFAEVGAAGLTNEVIAVRGERLVLVRRRMIPEPGLEVEAEILVVEESDDDGRIRVGVLFDPDDIEGALSELDSREREASGEIADPQH